MSKLISIIEASELLGVDNKTLRRRDKEGRLVPLRTLGGHRPYYVNDSRLYGSRGGKKLKRDIEKSLQELEQERYTL